MNIKNIDKYLPISNLNNNSNNYNEFGSVGFGLGIVSNELGFAISLDRLKNKVGFSFDLVLNFGPPDNQYYDNITFNTAKNTYNDKQLEDITQSLVFNLGPNFRLNNSLSLITGISIARNYTYTKFYDNFEILGNNGNYYVDNKSYTDFGFYGGLYYRASNKAGIKITGSTTNTLYLTYNFIIL